MSKNNSSKAKAKTSKLSRSRSKPERSLKLQFQGHINAREDWGEVIAIDSEGEQLFTVEFTDSWNPAMLKFADGRVMEGAYAGSYSSEPCPKCDYDYADVGFLFNGPGKDVNEGYVADFFGDNRRVRDVLEMSVTGDDACEFYENLFAKVA